MRLSRLILPTFAIALCAPQAAQAATLAPLRACYRSVDESRRETVRVQGEGFTPGAVVEVSIDGTIVSTEARALADGTVSGDVSAPYQARGEQPFTLTATERDRPANTASATSRVTALHLRLKPRKARPSRRVRFIGRGFIDGPEVYGHYLHGGRLRKTVLLGRPRGACGLIDVKRRQIPIRRPKTGRWTLQVDNQPQYSEQPVSVRVRVPITVRQELRRP
ncbi:MAG: hypothetical protein ACRDK0_07625 [Solirubrobacteraceae bacterium]